MSAKESHISSFISLLLFACLVPAENEVKSRLWDDYGLSVTDLDLVILGVYHAK